MSTSGSLTVTALRGSLPNTDCLACGAQDSRVKVHICSDCATGSCQPPCTSSKISNNNNPQWNLNCQWPTVGSSSSIYFEVEDDE